MCALKTDQGAVLKGVCLCESVLGQGNGLGKRQGDQMGRKLLWLLSEVMMRTPRAVDSREIHEVKKREKVK